MKIAMLGAGAFGTALGEILEAKGFKVGYYDAKMLDNSLSDVTSRANYIVLCVPSSALDELLPEVPKNVPMVVTTKGIMDDEIFENFEDWMAMSGPGFAEEIRQGKPTVMTMTDERVSRLFETDYLKFDYTADRRGVLLCGALKNIYAIGAGYRKLERDSVEWREYITQVVDEMKAILEVNGTEAKTVDLACGVKDLELTCGLPSRNYEYGLKLADDASYLPEKTVEGLSALARVDDGDIVVPESAVILRSIMNLHR